MAPTELINSKEARDLLKVSRSTLHRYVKSGKVPVRRTPGGQLRFSATDLAALIAPPRQDQGS
jgi:excisionase family DNA binding protein